MIILLFLVNAFYTNGRPIYGPHLDPRAQRESCDDIHDCRKLFDIIWGCLVTIFACTWVSVHPNVSPPNQSRLVLFLRRLKMTLIAMIAPELVVGFAVRQYLAARSFSRGQYLLLAYFNISLTHGFFICMGGFVSRSRHNPIVTKKQLAEHLGFITDIRAVEEEDIKDRSKGDTMSKGVVSVQGLWFMVQCLARIHQHLPVSELETITLVFVIVNFWIYAMWWKKPLDVQRPILVGPRDNLPQDAPESEQEQNLLLDGSTGATPLHVDPKPWRGGFWDGISGVLYGSYGDNYNPTAYTSVPSFWSTHSDQAQNETNPVFLLQCLLSITLGAIHFADWNQQFPSTPEMWIWRAITLLVTAIPTFVAGAQMVRWSGRLDGNSSWYSLVAVVFLLLVYIYPVARLFLIVLPLVSLRELPSGALTDVNWSVYIPHF
ncbi:hypothetical protein C8R43DRAFT_951110 [Mycena crocata]|nr:hypothetical protein C8R43DRAFT_951110 [Mycena crocata]